MGRYMKKSKISGDVAVVEVPPSLGVRTRSKTLALQRFQSPSTDSSSFSYLQLRSRRLEKPSLLCETKNQVEEEKVKRNPNRKSCVGAEEACFVGKGEVLEVQCEAEDRGVEDSFGENCLEFEARGRSTRESTPCSFLRDPDTIATPGSTTRLRYSTATNRRERGSIQTQIPTTREMEEFFAFAEQQQQRLFMEKYNFDVVNDLPLKGRYEWIPVNP